MFPIILEGKWKITYEEWPWTHYPPYFNGPAVLITGSAILPLLACFQTTPMLLRAIDDVYYSGICPEKTGIKIHFSNDTLRYIYTHIYLQPVLAIRSQTHQFVTRNIAYTI